MNIFNFRHVAALGVAALILAPSAALADANADKANAFLAGLSETERDLGCWAALGVVASRAKKNGAEADLVNKLDAGQTFYSGKIVAATKGNITKDYVMRGITNSTKAEEGGFLAQFAIACHKNYIDQEQAIYKALN